MKKNNSLKLNIVSNYISQIYVAFIGIIILPLYIKYVGSEVYGLIGFFTMLQSWFGLLDIGLTPTIARETARFRGGTISPIIFRQLFRSLNIIFIVVAILGGIILFSLSDKIAMSWLKINKLSFNDVIFCIQVMAISIPLRWMGGLYRGVIVGSEKLQILSLFNIVIATLRFIGVFITMKIFGYTPIIYFLHQLVIVIIEWLGLFLICRNLLPKVACSQKIGWSFKPVIPILKFSISIAFTSIIWIAITQTDKLILSSLLPLEQYGYYTLAVLVAGGITIISSPISNAIMPRMAKLYSENKIEELLILYKKSTQFVCIIVCSASIVIFFTSYSLLYLWTKDQKIANYASSILKYYALGNGFIALAAFPYYLQYAIGKLRFHIIGNILFAIILLPLIVIIANSYGGLGVSITWCFVNLVFFLIWPKFIHDKFVPNLHTKWLLHDVIRIYIPVFILVFICSYLYEKNNLINSDLMFILIISIVSLVVALFSSTLLKGFTNKS